MFATGKKLSCLLTLAIVSHVLCEISTGHSNKHEDVTLLPGAEQHPAAGTARGSSAASSTWNGPDGKNGISSSSGDTMKKLLAKGCSQRYTITCLKLDMVSLVERLAETDKYQLLPGVTVVRDNNSLEQQGRAFQSAADLMASLAKEFPNDADARVDAYLLRRIGQYLDTHSIAVKLFDDDSLQQARDMQDEYEMDSPDLNVDKETGRGKGKKGMGQLMMMLMMMKGTLLPIAFGTLAMLAGKALMTGLLSLMLSAIIGLKSLTSHHGKQAVTYEIVQKPVYSHSHSHSHELHHEHGGGSTSGGGYGHSSYGRSFGPEPGTLTFQDAPEDADPHQLAYNGYRDDLVAYS